jgi:hypothetical protein
MSSVAIPATWGQFRARHHLLAVKALAIYLGDFIMAHPTGDRFEILLMRKVGIDKIGMAIDAFEISVNGDGKF